MILTLYNVIIYGDNIVTYYFLRIFIMEQNKKIEKEEQGAFSIKKQIIYIVVFVALIALTFYAIVSQNENLTLEGFLNYTFSLKMGWLIAAVMCVFLFILLEGLSIRYIAAKLGYKRGYYQSFIYSAADIYFSAITPSASGGQPASAFFMVKDKIPMSVTTITLILNVMQYTASLSVIAAACFILRPEYFFIFDSWSKLLIILGIVFQLFLTLFFALLIFFPNIIKKSCEGVINLLFRIHLLRKRRRKLNKLYQMMDEYQECAKIIKESPAMIGVAFLLNLLQRVSVVAVTYCVYMGSGQTGHSFIDIMTVQGYVLIGSNSLPVPGAVGIADYLLLLITQDLLLRVKGKRVLNMLGFYNYTVILTYLSLCSAVTGIFVGVSGTGHPFIATTCLMVCGFLDAFDGIVARSKKDRTEQEKKFGIQIDSLVDLVAFGVLPCAIGYSCYTSHYLNSFKLSDKWHFMKPLANCKVTIFFIVFALFVLAALIRLAYFNVMEEERQNKTDEKRKYYLGLPVTSSCLIFPTIMLIQYIIGKGFDISPFYVVAMLIVAFLYVSKIKIKKPGLKGIMIMVAIGAVEFGLLLFFRFMYGH